MDKSKIKTNDIKNRLVNYFYQKLHPFYKRKRMLAFYSQFVNKDDLCFDIGAHKGNRTEVFLALGAKVIALEPQRDCIDYLKKKFNKNSRLTLINKGLANKKGRLPFYICEKETVISTFSNRWKTGRFSNYHWNKKVLVPVTTLDYLIEKFGLPTFCKIDVEGFELPVLKGLSQPIPYISFEFNREFFKETCSAITYLSSLGQAKFNCSLGESDSLIFKNWAAPKKIYQLVDLLDDNLLWGDIYAKYEKRGN